MTVAAWAAGPSAGAAAASAVAFSTPGSYSFVVPANVLNLTITAIGGAGGACVGGATGGEGATISETVPVTPGAQLTVGVAGDGGACDAMLGAGAGGVGGGGASGTAVLTGPSGGGGGASIVRASSGILIVAGGGGGATDGNSAVNGGDAGSPGADGGVPGSEGQPGTQTEGGGGGAAGSVNATAGSPGTFLAGGAGGNGDASDPSVPSLGGPGGGAGYYGGGGAGGSALFTNTGGGGGGSSYTVPGASGISGPTPSAATPEVVIAYSPRPAPTARTAAASRVGVTKATLSGIVNPESLLTTYRFQYGTTTAYGHTTKVSSAGSGGSTVNASTVLSGLKPNTRYHFRMVASNASGTKMGVGLTFKTKPRHPSIKLHPRKLQAGKKLHISGSAGACTAHRVILISQAFAGRHSFAGVPAVYAKVQKRSGTYSVTTKIPSSMTAGRYKITARCGGGNLGVSARLRVL